MSKTPYEQVWEFHKAFGQPRYTFPALPDRERRDLRRALLKEEYQEYLDGEGMDDLVQIADALADMTYIIYGTGIEYGLPMDELFAEVHRSNMSKLDPETGKPIYREDGKIMKPASYSKPDLAAIIARFQGDLSPEFMPEPADDLGVEVMDAICKIGNADDAYACDSDEDASDCCTSNYYPKSAMADDFTGEGPRIVNPPERFVVHANVGTATKDRLAAFKDEFLSDAREKRDEAIYYFLPTLGEPRIERI